MTSNSLFYGRRRSHPFAGLTTRYLAQMIAGGSPDREAMLAEIARREDAKKRRAAADEKCAFCGKPHFFNGNCEAAQ